MTVDTTDTLSSVTATGVELPYDRPIQTAFGAMASADLVLVDVTTSDGVRGCAYVRCYSPLAMRPVVELVNAIGASLVGEPLAPVPIWRELRGRFRLLGTEGLIGLAVNGIDMAIWDALACRLGLPLAALLGGRPRPLQAYASLRSMHAADVAEEAVERCTEGFRALKVKVGSGDMAADRTVLEALREAVGSSVDLMCDFNQSLGATEAIRRIEAFADVGLRWVEEPVLSQDLGAMALVAARTSVAIQAGESWWSPEEAARNVAGRACDLVMLDVARIGGVTGWCRAAAAADAAGLAVSSHTFPEFSIQLLVASTHVDLAEWLDSVNPLVVHPLVVDNGVVQVPDRPGAGIEWDPEAVERYRVA